MADLRLNARAEAMDTLDQLAVLLDEAILTETERLRLVTLRAVDRTHFQRDQTDTAGGARLVVADQALGYLELLAPVIGRHRRHHQPVAHVHAADRDRAEQVFEILHDSRSERFRIIASSLPAPRCPSSLPS